MLSRLRQCFHRKSVDTDMRSAAPAGPGLESADAEQIRAWERIIETVIAREKSETSTGPSPRDADSNPSCEVMSTARSEPIPIFSIDLSASTPTNSLTNSSSSREDHLLRRSYSASSLSATMSVLEMHGYGATPRTQKQRLKAYEDRKSLRTSAIITAHISGDDI